jgi:hypothetical protein
VCWVCRSYNCSGFWASTNQFFGLLLISNQTWNSLLKMKIHIIFSWMKNEIRMKHESLQNLKKMQLSKHKEAKIQKIILKHEFFFCENYLHKDYSKTQIAKRHYVQYFTLLMIIKKLI